MEQEFKKNRDLKDMDTVFENKRAQSTEEKADVPDDNVKDPTQVGNYTADNIQILEGLEAEASRYIWHFRDSTWSIIVDPR